jgi:MoaA/NifB/PqqE/SkfB family radical SAM enzyme
MIEVSFERGPLGLPSRLADTIGGKPLLWWTVKKALMIEGVSRVYVAGLSEDAPRVRELLGGLQYEFTAVPAVGSVAGPDYVRRRKWALGSWQGGLNEATVFSEEGHPAGMLEVARKAGAGSVIKLPAAGPLADAAEAARVIEELSEDAPFRMTNAPPGLGIEVYSRPIIEQMIRKKALIDTVLKLNLQNPLRDPTLIGLVHAARQDVSFARGRFLGDSARGWALLEGLYRQWGEAWLEKTAAEVAEAYYADADLVRGRFPREVEIEVTTAGNAGQPAPEERPEAVMDVALFGKALQGLDEADDVLLTLGGYGDPLMHPEPAALFDAAKAAGVFGIHVHTDGLSLDGENIETLAKSEVDVVSVALDAATEETFEKVKGRRGLEEVAQRVEELMHASVGRGYPFVVPEFTKQAVNRGELEAFFERWYQVAGWAVVRTQDDPEAGLKEEAPLPLLLGRRVPCEHLFERMFVLVDGRVPVCIRDCTARKPLGNVVRDELGELWRGEEMAGLVKAHTRGEFGAFELCGNCKRWLV